MFKEKREGREHISTYRLPSSRLLSFLPGTQFTDGKTPTGCSLNSPQSPMQTYTCAHTQGGATSIKRKEEEGGAGVQPRLGFRP